MSRLPLYLQALDELPVGQRTISSQQLAKSAGVRAANVRKDLSHLGSYGTRGVGYDVAPLRLQIARRLGMTRSTPIAIVGAGHLGRALAGYAGFVESGFEIVALFDTDPAKVGTNVHGYLISSMADLDAVAASPGISIGIITTPGSSAQAVADRLAEAGIRSILNFAPVTLEVPKGVEVRRVDLATELQILSYYLNEAAGL